MFTKLAKICLSLTCLRFSFNLVLELSNTIGHVSLTVVFATRSLTTCQCAALSRVCPRGRRSGPWPSASTSCPRTSTLSGTSADGTRSCGGKKIFSFSWTKLLISGKQISLRQNMILNCTHSGVKIMYVTRYPQKSSGMS